MGSQDAANIAHNRWAYVVAILGVLLVNSMWWNYVSWDRKISHRTGRNSVMECTHANLHSGNLSFLDSAKPILPTEFIERQDRLAQALVVSETDGFVLEPGYTFQYYGNTSQKEWEPWEPEENPFLMIIAPQTSSSGEITARTIFLAVSFEEARIRGLGIPTRGQSLDLITYEENESPYETLLSSGLLGQYGPRSKLKLMMDEELRDFISRGLQTAGVETVGIQPEVERVRQIKSPAEIEILRAVNTGTVEALRSMQPCLVPGMTENEVSTVLQSALRSIGFALFFDIVLFDEHATSPSGGSYEDTKILTEETMILIDVGAQYMGMVSDVCRSFFISPRKDQSKTAFGLYQEKLEVWDIVLRAQKAAASALKPGHTAASVDLAARQAIEDAGYSSQCYTHGLGHSIAIKAHEPPYLTKWNTETILQPGMVFEMEPAIYIDGKFGVRIEDTFLVTEFGEAQLLSGKLAAGPYQP